MSATKVAKVTTSIAEKVPISETVKGLYQVWVTFCAVGFGMSGAFVTSDRYRKVDPFKRSVMTIGGAAKGVIEGTLLGAAFPLSLGYYLLNHNDNAECGYGGSDYNR